MPAAVTFKVLTRYKLDRGEPGLTSLDSHAMPARSALAWILSEFPDEAVSVTGSWTGRTVISIDWSKTPDSLNRPQLARGR